MKVKNLNDTTSFDDAGADSFDFVTVVLAAETAYGLHIPWKDYAHVTTLKDLATYINGKLRKGIAGTSMGFSDVL
jgi:acyl carrier protein